MLTLKRKKKQILFLCSCFFILCFSTLVFQNNYTESENNDIKKNIFISNESEIKVSSNTPEIPQINFPLNESIHTTNIVKFDWNPVGQPSDNIFYEFVMDNDTDFNTPELARFALNDWSNFTMSDDQYTTFIAHFDDDQFKSEENEAPKDPLNNLTLVDGLFDKGVFINSSSNPGLGYTRIGNLNLTQGTVEFWIKLEKDMSQISNLAFIFDVVLLGDPLNRFGIALDADNKVKVISVVNNSLYWIIPDIVSNWKAEVWHHVCLTWGKEMGRLYLDGLEVGVSTYFPIGKGNRDDFYIGSQVLGSYINVNASYDEFRISSIQRLPVWKPQNANINVSYFGQAPGDIIGVPIQRYPIWNLNKTEFFHMFEKDGTYFWKVRAHNTSGPGDWSIPRILTINRLLNENYSVSIKILDKYGTEIPNANLSYYQQSVNKMMGIDANYVNELIEGGYHWFHEGEEIDMYKFLGEKKFNSFRTRLWTNENGKNSLGNATIMSKWAQGNGSIPYLTIFLSDDWSDVNKAPLPKMFEALTFEERLSAIEIYCRNVAEHFKDEGINMEFYEIGNEIDFGLCGVYADTNTPRYNLTWLKENIWYNASRIIKAAINGVRQADPSAEFMLHIAISDPAFALAFFTAMNDFGVDFNIMGLSYYPSHGGDAAENSFKETIMILSTSGLPGSDKIIIPETAYGSNNSGTSVFPKWIYNITEFPQTPEGQKSWVKHQLEWIYQHPNIYGMNYWSLEWYEPLVWGPFSWFNSTGDSKIVVDAYPEFFNLRNMRFEGWDISNNHGNVFFEATRGFIQLKIQYGTHIEYFNISASPFRDNSFNIKLSISITPPDGDDDDDDDDNPPSILGYDLLIIGSVIFLISLVYLKFLILNSKKKNHSRI